MLYGLYLVYDVQLLLGDGRYGYSIDDYVIASVQIYLDVIILFLKSLKFLKIMV